MINDGKPTSDDLKLPLRTFKQYLYCLGYEHQTMRKRVDDRTWLSDDEYNSYLAGVTDAMQDGHSDYHCSDSVQLVIDQPPYHGRWIDD